MNCARHVILSISPCFVHSSFASSSGSTLTSHGAVSFSLSHPLQQHAIETHVSCREARSGMSSVILRLILFCVQPPLCQSSTSLNDKQMKYVLQPTSRKPDTSKALSRARQSITSADGLEQWFTLIATTLWDNSGYTYMNRKRIRNLCCFSLLSKVNLWYFKLPNKNLHREEKIWKSSHVMHLTQRTQICVLLPCILETCGKI